MQKQYRRNRSSHDLRAPSRAIVEAVEPRTLLSSSPLDLTFGYQGSVNGDPLLFENGGATAIHVLADGDILVAGTGLQVDLPSMPNASEVARFLPDGEVDRTFGTNGVASAPGGFDTGMVVTPTGDIILAGLTNFGIATISRLTPNGVIDPSFGSDGTYQLIWSPIISYRANLPIAEASDGSIYLAGGIANANGTTSFSLAKIDATGKHFSTFNYPIQTYSAAAALTYVNSMLVLGGYSSTGSPGSAADTSQFTLLGVNTNGTIDTSFGSRGIVRTGIEVTSSVSGLAVSPNGDIVALGTSINDGNTVVPPNENSQIRTDIALTRYTSTGTLDSTFGDSGIVVTYGGDTAPAIESYIQSVYTPAVAVETDGSVVIAGNIDAGDEGQFLTVHYSATGNLLATSAFDVSSEQDTESFEAVAIDGQNILAAGNVDTENIIPDEYSRDLILAKLNPDLTLNNDFAVDQSISIPYAIGTNTPLQASVAVGDPAGYVVATYPSYGLIKSVTAPNGQILFLGPGATGNTSSFPVRLVRYNTDGSRDLSFTDHGPATALTVQSDGKILLVGNGPFRRLNTDGSTDASFNATGPDLTGASSVVELPSGDILVADGADVYRFLPNGTFDTSFGISGVATNADFIASAMTVESNGSIVVVGGDTVERFTASGLIDTNFKTMGLVTLSDSNQDTDLADVVLIDSEGNILVGGEDTIEAYLADGSLNPSFGIAGVQTVNNLSVMTGNVFNVGALSMDKAGNILVGASTLGEGPEALVRLTPHGNFDPVFGSAGYAVVNPLPFTTDYEVNGIFANAAGQIDLVGIGDVNNNYVFSPTIARFNDVGGITGTIFNDLNSNGKRDGGEPALAGWSAYMDLNNDGKFDDNDVQVVSDANGDFVFPNLAPGTYDLRQDTPAGWKLTQPASFPLVVKVAAGTTTTVLIGNEKLPTHSLSGVVFNDSNADGKQESGDVGIAGRTVYADLNNNSRLDPNEPRAITNSEGQYTLTGLPAGALLIRQILPAGQRETTPAYGGAFHVTLGSTALANINFGCTTAVYISGQVFNDLNSNGRVDTGETGLANVRVYIDVANTGSYLPSDDPSVLTDSSGNFVFTDLAATTFILRIVLPRGDSQTIPASNSLVLVPLASGGVKLNLLFGVKKIA